MTKYIWRKIYLLEISCFLIYLLRILWWLYVNEGKKKYWLIMSAKTKKKKALWKWKLHYRVEENEENQEEKWRGETLYMKIYEMTESHICRMMWSQAKRRRYEEAEAGPGMKKKTSLWKRRAWREEKKKRKINSIRERDKWWRKSWRRWLKWKENRENSKISKMDEEIAEEKR